MRTEEEVRAERARILLRIAELRERVSTPGVSDALIAEARISGCLAAAIVAALDYALGEAPTAECRSKYLREDRLFEEVKRSHR